MLTIVILQRAAGGLGLTLAQIRALSERVLDRLSQDLETSSDSPKVAQVSKVDVNSVLFGDLGESSGQPKTGRGRRMSKRMSKAAIDAEMYVSTQAKQTPPEMQPAEFQAQLALLNRFHTQVGSRVYEYL